ncbi:extracellular solute-binding protein [Mediterraneibacter sp. NSJ-55]|uniref:Extracellular solute-binding protein n=1 Tax=Mediterraneibacter hominis TaxID=2763054 RepID=A0A923LJW8_9FIRM|nr:extracellular solute-binding protein [Mediterraneibacter hominis]MBC5689427.1 extracellular solute-binding protein [Mediterraneibacter hominis]
MEEKKILKGITWAHSRGYTSIVAVSQRFMELNKDVEITWEKRSLQEFADAPIEELSKRYDLLIIDHPWAGFAAKHGILLPLQKYLSAAYLKDQEENSVGKSYVSYDFDGFLSALPIDAATPIAVYRPDYFETTGEKVPQTFKEVLELAKKGKVIYAGIPINLLMDFYMFGITAGYTMFNGEEVIGREDGCTVLEEMRRLSSLCTKEIFDWDPIAVHEALSSEEKYAYCPFAYGYTNYSKEGYAKHLLKACNVVSYKGEHFHTVLGGTGLAVSAACENRETAVKFAEYAVSPLIQRTLFFEAGGQPGHRGAWLDEECNRRSLDFFKDTLRTLDESYLRPRYSGYLYFQDRAGSYVREYLMNGGNPAEVLENMNKLYRKSMEVDA